MAAVGDLVRSTMDSWIVRAPQACPAGHALRPGRVLVGYQACTGHPGGHTTWTCRECGQSAYGPPLAGRCSIIAGPTVPRKDH